MKKEIVWRCFSGAGIGLAVSTIIAIVISLTLGDGAYHPVVPEFAAECGELNAVIIQMLLSFVYGAAWGGASVVWEKENWSLMRQTVTHLVICSLATFPVAYITHWMSHDLGSVLAYFGIFLGIYAIIWLSYYTSLKKRVKQMNDKMKND